MHLPVITPSLSSVLASVSMFCFQLNVLWIRWTSTSWRANPFGSCGARETPVSADPELEMSSSRTSTKRSTIRPCTTPSRPLETFLAAKLRETKVNVQKNYLYLQFHYKLALDSGHGLIGCAWLFPADNTGYSCPIVTKLERFITMEMNIWKSE